MCSLSAHCKTYCFAYQKRLFCTVKAQVLRRKTAAFAVPNRNQRFSSELSLQNHKKVATIDNTFLMFSSTLQEHHIFVILPNILLYFSVSVVPFRYHKRNLQGSEHSSLVFQKHRVGKTKILQSNDKKKVFSAYFCLCYPEKTLPL